MSSLRSVLVSAALLVVLAMCNGQLTFSPNWGKRSTPTRIFGSYSGKCLNADDTLMDIFKFVQNEVQVYTDCNEQRQSNNVIPNTYT